jgi:hypothetical protein
MKTRGWHIENGKVGRVTPCAPTLENERTARRGLTRPTFNALMLLGFILLHFAFCLSASAQNYAIDWYKVAGGGGTSTAGVFSVSGTVGQPDASSAMTGGSYSLTGGFWSLYAVQTPRAPLLTITYVGNQAIVSWPPSATSWTLQTNANLATDEWGNYLGTVVNNSVTNAPQTRNVFFRLKQ